MAALDVSVRYEPDERGMLEVAFLAGLRAYTANVAGQYAQAVAGAWPRHTGAGARSVHPGETGQDRDGAYSTVATRAWWWHFVEFGSINNPPYAPFRRAAQALGLRWEDSR